LLAPQFKNLLDVMQATFRTSTFVDEYVAIFVVLPLTPVVPADAFVDIQHEQNNEQGCTE
jgi:hypothetical protein